MSSIHVIMLVLFLARYDCFRMLVGGKTMHKVELPTVASSAASAHQVNE